MVTALSQPEHYLVVNYARKGVEQKGGGHYAPVAAYDGDSDSFLILDPNNADYLWHWVDATSMIKAMNTIDVDRYRATPLSPTKKKTSKPFGLLAFQHCDYTISEVIAA